MTSWTLCTSGAIVIKAGANCNSTAAASNAILSQYYDEAESLFNVATRTNWTDKYASLNADIKNIISGGVSSKAGMLLIEYDPSGYSSLAEAQTMLDVLSDNYDECVKTVIEGNKKEFIEGA